MDLFVQEASPSQARAEDMDDGGHLQIPADSEELIMEQEVQAH
jgi:hypothetical protein